MLPSPVNVAPHCRVSMAKYVSRVDVNPALRTVNVRVVPARAAGAKKVVPRTPIVKPERYVNKVDSPLESVSSPSAQHKNHAPVGKSVTAVVAKIAKMIAAVKKPRSVRLDPAR